MCDENDSAVQTPKISSPGMYKETRFRENDRMKKKKEELSGIAGGEMNKERRTRQFVLFEGGRSTSNDLYECHSNILMMRANLCLSPRTSTKEMTKKLWESSRSIFCQKIFLSPFVLYATALRDAVICRT